MELVDGQMPGIYWQSRMGNNSDGIGGNCHRYDVVTADAEGRLAREYFIVDLGVKLGHQRSGYACEFPSPEGLLPRAGGRRAPQSVVAPAALLLTHAHEDHLGAVRHVLDMGFSVPPVYCTAFTAQLLDKSLVNAGIERQRRPRIVVIRPGDVARIANADVEFVAVDHMPGAVALSLRTAEASVFHTGDYKFDDSLLLGERADLQRLRAIGSAGVDAVVSDSTAVSEVGDKVAEAEIRRTLTGLVAANKGRAIIAGILGTQLDRLVSLGRAAAANDRFLVVTGRSLEDNLRALRLSGIDIDAAAGTHVMVPAEAAELAASRALVVTTGAFAQPHAGLTRAAERLPNGLLVDGDTTVIIPQRAIAPVKAAHSAMVDRLERLGATVITAERAETSGIGPIHQSGHAIEKDTRLLYSLLRPTQIVAPMHGNTAQLEANARLVRSLGIAALPLEGNGAVVRITHGVAEVVGREAVRRIGAAETGEHKQLPRARKGEGRGGAPAPAVYRYDELDADGRTVLAADIRPATRPNRPKAARRPPGPGLRDMAGDRRGR